MKLLLDTHLVLWWLADSRELSAEGRALIAAPENAVFVSAASVWELRIKEALGKVKLPADFSAVLDDQHFEFLSVTVAHAHAVRELPMHHRDPFDRMLVAQARGDGLTLLTHDEVLSRYDVDHKVV